MYAIIQSGGKQYRVSEGDVVSVERDVLGSAEKDKVTFGEVLMIGGDQPKIGSPAVKGASVVGVFWGDFARREPKAFAESAKQLARWYGEGKLRPHVSQTLPLARAAEAIKLLASRQAKGKVVLTTGA